METNKSINKYSFKAINFDQEMLVHSICDLYNYMGTSGMNAKYNSIDDIITIEFETAYSHQLIVTSKLIDSLNRIENRMEIISENEEA